VSARAALVAGFVAVAIAVAGCSAGEQATRTTTTTVKNADRTGGAGVVPEPVPDTTVPAGAVELSGLKFTDVTVAAGLDRDRSTRDLFGEDGMTGGVSVVDVDVDGRPDLFLNRTGDVNSLYRNNGDGTFTDIAATSGLQGPNPQFGSGPAEFFDANGDGAVDVYLAAVGAESDRLYLNDGKGRFTDRTQASGVFQPPPTRLRNGDQVHGVTSGDVDGDGDLDLVVVQWDTAVTEAAANAGAQREASSGDGRLDRFGDVCGATAEVRRKGIDRVPLNVPNRSRLWINDGTGRFTDGTATWRVPFDQILAFTPVLADVDGDGRQDLAVTGDACTSRLLRNDGDRFTDITESAGVGTDENGMGSVVRDVDGDGRPDWFVTGISYPTVGKVCPVVSSITGCSGNRLFRNNGDGTFSDRTDRLGLRHGWWGWGAAVEDFTNTGQVSVAQANGFAEQSARQPATSGNWVREYFRWFLREPMRFWVRDSRSTRLTFVDVAGQVGLADTKVTTGMAPVDYDGDGDLDLVAVRSEGAPALYRNDSPARRWLTVQLSDPGTPGNRSAVGAVVTVDPDRGSARRTVAQVQTGGSYESQKLPEVHAGLGSATTATVTVRWPGPADKGEPQVVKGVTADQVLTVERAG
jgi:hypothetical protein